MTTRAADILQNAMSLTEAERVELAARLLDSLDSNTPSAQEEWDREIERRLAQIDGNHVQPISWTDARRQIELPRS
ncbi:MAG: addiction module protein [Planctomycetes bacterium]|nr:addiction module protein [Planctomycetota bacterium]